jgi:ATP adenylyltransferase
MPKHMGLKKLILHLKCLKIPMKQLHSYWRIDYIEVPKEHRLSDPFSQLPQERDELQSLLLLRSSQCYVVLNRFPYNAGHLLVIPYCAVADLTDLNPEERCDLMETIVRSETILKKALKPDAFNVGFNIGEAAGAGIPQHLHVHIVPRWSGDTNFMPVIASTRVLPRALEGLWHHLRPYFDTSTN